MASTPMRIEIILRAETRGVDLCEGLTRLGGGKGDDIRIEGLPPAVLSLTVEGTRLVVAPRRSQRVGSATAHLPRLLVPGEELRLPNDVILKRPPEVDPNEVRRNAETALVAKELLSGVLEFPQFTRAASFTCVAGFDRGSSFPVALNESFIGRGLDAHVRLRDRSVSRRHAALIRRGKHAYLRPIANTNGTYLNNRPVEEEVRLQSGDILEVGQTLIRYEGPESGPDELTPVRPMRSPALPGCAPRETEVDLATLPLPKPPIVPRLEWALMALGTLLAAAGIAIGLAWTTGL